MTDREALLAFRMREAAETLADAERMLESGLSPRSVSNRAYYAMFYAVLALFLKSGTDLQTSKHAGVISIFDREFVHTGKLDTRLSKLLHNPDKPEQTCHKDTKARRDARVSCMFNIIENI
ncbi:MAG: HEPN domain-containing protein [Nitrospirota bacterium]